MGGRSWAGSPRHGARARRPCGQAAEVADPAAAGAPPKMPQGPRGDGGGRRDEVERKWLCGTRRRDSAPHGAMLGAMLVFGVFACVRGAGASASLVERLGLFEGHDGRSCGTGDDFAGPPAEACDFYNLTACRAPNHVGLDGSARHSPPMIIFAAGGCVGSTAVQTVARGMVEAHGHVVAPLGFEILKPSKNGCLRALADGKNTTGLQHQVPAIDAMLSQVRDQLGMAVVLKLGPARGGTYVGMPARRRLVHAGAAAANVVRKNVLDFLVCYVRDCFIADRDGHPVRSDGTRSAACFEQRRGSEAGTVKAEKTLAYLNTTTLLRSLLKLEKANRVQRQALRFAGFRSGETVSSEALLSFQYGRQYCEHPFACRAPARSCSLVRARARLYAVDCETDRSTETPACVLAGEESIEAWRKFLRGAFRPRLSRIVSFMKNATRDGWRNPPGPHAETIYNIDEVAEVLANTRYARMLRS